MYLKLNLEFKSNLNIYDLPEYYTREHTYHK